MNKSYETEISNREISGGDEIYAGLLNKPVVNFIPWKKQFILPDEGDELDTILNTIATAVTASMSYECWGEVNVSVSTVIKNNNLVLHGIIIKLRDQCVIPTVYIEEILENTDRTDLMCNLADRIVEAYTDGLKVAPTIAPRIGTSYESLAGLLEFRVVDTEMNSSRLDKLVHKKMNCGLSLVLYAIIEQDNCGIMGLAITEEIAEHMCEGSPDRDRLFLKAICNMVEFHLPVMVSLQDVVQTDMGRDVLAEGEENLLCDYDMNQWVTGAMREELSELEKEDSYEASLPETESDSESEMYILTNDSGAMGAATLFYPGIQEMIADILNSDYYILPSSVHEVIIVPDRGEVSTDFLRDMVKDANNTFLEKQDILSYRVFRYSRQDRTLSAAEE